MDRIVVGADGRHGMDGNTAPVVENGKVVGIITGEDLLSKADIGLRISLQRPLPPQIYKE